MKIASFEIIVRALQATGTRYLVVGGLAVNAHGFGRTTFDVDLVVALEPANVRGAFGALRGIGYRPALPVTAEQFADPAQREAWRVEKGMMVLKFWSDEHPETPVDVFVAEPFPFQEEFRLACREPLAPGLTVPYVRLQTLLMMKQGAGRRQDLVDIDELTLLHGPFPSGEPAS